MPQPGWYADPDGTPERLRWWDGTRWTDHVHGDGPAAATRPARRGPWPWVALALTVGLVVTVGFGLTSGLFGRGTAAVPDPAAPLPGATPTAPSPTDGTPAPTPSMARLPSVTPVPRSSAPAFTPTPMPSLPTGPMPTAAPDGCPKPASDAVTLSDGQLAVTIPASWGTVDGLTWLTCTQAATAPEHRASVTLGLSPFPARDLQDAAEYVWAIALLDAAIPHPLSQTSTPVTAGGLDGWMITGTVALGEELDELTVIVVASGQDPSVLVTLAGTNDEEARAAVSDILSSVRAP